MPQKNCEGSANVFSKSQKTWKDEMLCVRFKKSKESRNVIATAKLPKIVGK
jgi:hypothetical protein